MDSTDTKSIKSNERENKSNIKNDLKIANSIIQCSFKWNVVLVRDYIQRMIKEEE